MWNTIFPSVVSYSRKMNFEYVLCLSLTIFCKTKFGWIIYKDDLYFLASLTLSRKSKLNIYRAHMNFWLVLASDGKWFHRYSSKNGTNVECRLRLFRLWFHVQRNRVWMCFVLTYGQSILRAKEREREREWNLLVQRFRESRVWIFIKHAWTLLVLVHDLRRIIGNHSINILMKI